MNTRNNSLFKNPPKTCSPHAFGDNVGNATGCIFTDQSGDKKHRVKNAQFPSLPRGCAVPRLSLVQLLWVSLVTGHL